MKIKLLLIVMVSTILILGTYASCLAVSVVLKWDPNTDADLAGYKVYYKADSPAMPFDGVGAASGASPVDVRNQTNVTISGLDPNHSYYFAVTAYNSSGVESGYSNIIAITESAPPTVSITSPSNSTSVSGTVNVSATASDNVGVTQVEFYVDGTLQTTETTTPYLFSWNTGSVSPGGHTLTAKAYDAAGNVGQSTSVNVTVVNDVTAPTVTLTAPANNATISGTTAITASASDNVGVTKVEFYDNGSLLYATNVSPYTYSWNTTSVADGSHLLYAKAYDATGNVGQSQNASLTVANNTAASTPLSISDAVAALQISAGNVQPTSAQMSRLDVAPVINGVSVPNGQIDTGDVIVILSKVVGKIAL